LLRRFTARWERITLPPSFFLDRIHDADIFAPYLPVSCHSRSSTFRPPMITLWLQIDRINP
jgi:hypothetical protein